MTDIPQPAHNEYVGETFLDMDSRTLNRRVQIVGTTRAGRYICEVVTSESTPHTVGRRYTISARTLDRRFRKVSR